MSSFVRPTNMGLAFVRAALTELKKVDHPADKKQPAALNNPAVPWVARRVGLMQGTAGTIKEISGRVL